MTYGLNDLTQLTAYFAEADDDTYGLLMEKVRTIIGKLCFVFKKKNF